MKNRKISFIEALTVEEVAPLISHDYAGVIRVVPAGTFGKTQDLHFNGQGVIEDVKGLGFSDIDILVELKKGNVNDFVTLYSKMHPGYTPIPLTFKESLSYRKHKGILTNLTPINIVK